MKYTRLGEEFQLNPGVIVTIGWQTPCIRIRFVGELLMPTAIARQFHVSKPSHSAPLSRAATAPSNSIEKRSQVVAANVLNEGF